MGTLGKRQIVLLVVLGMVLAYAAYDLLSSDGSSNKKDPPPNAELKQPAPAEKDVSQELLAQVQAARQAEIAVALSDKSKSRPTKEVSWLRDPFAARYDVETKVDFTGLVQQITQSRSSGLTLTAITRKGDRSFVLINEEVLTTGESINGFTVTEILQNSVVLTRNNFTFTLKLREEE